MEDKAEELAKHFGAAFDLVHHKRSLIQLFPYGHQDTPLMWRLAIVRDDISWELDEMARATIEHGQTGDADSLWKLGYFLRRISVSVLEARRILDSGIMKKHKQQAREYEHRAALYTGLLRSARALGRVARLLEPMRNSLGAHVDPDDGNPEKGQTEPFVTRGLRTHWDTNGEIHLNQSSPLGTSYREFTRLAFMFPWPEVTDFPGLQKKLEDFFQPVVAAAARLLAAIDAVLYAFWLDVGTIPARQAQGP